LIRKDYILRLIDELVRVLARVFQLKDLKSFDEALQLLRRESERLLGLDGGMMEILTTEDIRKALRSPEAALVAGRILEEMALIYEQTGEHQRATATAVKALDLYVGLMAYDPDAVDDDYRARMNGLADAIAERDLPWDDRRTLIRCYESLGRYANAEDLLFELIHEGFDRDRIIEDASAFYRRLLSKSDEELRAGGLPRREVNDGMNTLEEMSNEST